MLKLEEIMALAALMRSREVFAQMNMEIAMHYSRVPENYYGCAEQYILEDYTKWMTDAYETFHKTRETNGPYAGLSLIEFIAQSRPK